MKTILVIDDQWAAVDAAGQRYDRRAFEKDFGEAGFEFVFSTAEEEPGDYSETAALRDLQALDPPPDAVLLDVQFGSDKLLGLEILSTITSACPSVPVIMMTAAPKAELLRECIAMGAVDYLVKPLNRDVLRQTLNRYAGATPDHWLIGQNELFLRAVDQLARAAEGGTSPVLLLGPPGSGKELFARYLHRQRKRTGPFQPIHIPSISGNLVEAELFGYSKGAFTGATRDEPGRIARADGGVLFLDEVGDLSPTAQSALLRVLEAREVTRLGDGRTTRIDVQIVSATNVNLVRAAKNHTFRPDLYTRLSGVVISLPPLASRLDDLDLLLRHMFRRARIERNLALPAFAIPQDIVERLSKMPWDGNMRDLWNYAQRVLNESRNQVPSLADYEAALVHSDEAGEPSGRGESSSSRAVLERLPESVVRNPDAFLTEITLRELSLLYSALELTSDPVSGEPRRAKAAAVLKKKVRCSTNDFDRWVDRLLEKLSPEIAEQLESDYPRLVGRDLVKKEMT